MAGTMATKNAAASAIMASTKTDDQKLYEIFRLFADDIRAHNSQLYYALLGWADAHRRELKPLVSELPDYFK